MFAVTPLDTLLMFINYPLVNTHFLLFFIDFQMSAFNAQYRF